MTWLSTVAGKCIECNSCVKECRFLQKYGNPKSISEAYDPLDEKHQATAFE